MAEDLDWDNDFDIGSEEDDNEEDQVGASPPLRLIGMAADPDTKEEWDEDFEFGDDSTEGSAFRAFITPPQKKETKQNNNNSRQ